MAPALARRPTGLDLRLRRTVAGASQVELARVLGVSRQRVGHLESMFRPSAWSAQRYLEALDELTRHESVR